MLVLKDQILQELQTSPVLRGPLTVNLNYSANFLKIQNFLAHNAKIRNTNSQASSISFRNKNSESLSCKIYLVLIKF